MTFDFQNIYIAPMKTPIVKCSSCCGKGVTKLSGPLLRTFKIIQSHRNLTIPQLHKLMDEDLHNSASNQRVKKLVKLGLLKKQMMNGRRVYSPV